MAKKILGMIVFTVISIVIIAVSDSWGEFLFGELLLIIVSSLFKAAGALDKTQETA